jgi:hypothetical protein
MFNLKKIIMENLTFKQREFISKHYVTVEKDSRGHCRTPYVYHIAGTFYQQKGFETEYDAYIAGIQKVVEIMKKPAKN